MHAQSFLPKLKIHIMNGSDSRDCGYHFNEDMSIQNSSAILNVALTQKFTSEAKIRITNILGNVEEIQACRISQQTLNICPQKCNILSDSRFKVLRGFGELTSSLWRKKAPQYYMKFPRK